MIVDPPALIVREMQVQAIQLVERHQIEVPLHVVDREEMARDIEHRAAPGEPRAIDDAGRRRRETGRDASGLTPLNSTNGGSS